MEDLRKIEPKAREVYMRYLDELDGADVRELAIHRRVSRLNYSRRCTEASAVQAHTKQGLPLAPGMEIAYVVKDAKKWEVDPARTASEFETWNLLPVYDPSLKRDCGGRDPRSSLRVSFLVLFLYLTKAY